MRDRAIGKTRAERALGENMPKKTKKKAKKKPANPAKEYRATNPGMFSGPRPSYQRYEVGQMASDVLNKQSKAKRKEGK
jgi:hypothetical protein